MNATLGAILASAFWYFVATLIAGFGLGAMRTAWVTPRVGELAATALEAPFMIAICWAAAGAVMRRFNVRGLTAGIVVGLLWLLAFAPTEVALGHVLRGWDMAALAAHFVSPAGILSLVMFALAAIVPAVQGARLD